MVDLVVIYSQYSPISSLHLLPEASTLDFSYRWRYNPSRWHCMGSVIPSTVTEAIR